LVFGRDFEREANSRSVDARESNKLPANSPGFHCRFMTARFDRLTPTSVETLSSGVSVTMIKASGQAKGYRSVKRTYSVIALKF
jgi:hypothetical protein